ncbi:plasmid mobilization relaxosome protein MobC [Pseudoflavonifractor sp. 60]|uniref:plasmid mobilization relaxosome protein MobC n=1 Tax=Pseudoflavonifractor sp. 60 TaxID=2304576 RepID=UPI002433BDE1|nr:plasmid mobilization relaxosome protein MobC [Pseudoflavonifractor sp. 60]
MSIDGYVINLEIPELTECANLLRYISNNVNQMARQMNSGGSVYPDEVNDICTKQDETNRLFGDILEQLSRLK